jgi:hypothetical protein
LIVFNVSGVHGHINNLLAAAVDAVAQRCICHARQRRGDQARTDHYGQGTGEKDTGREIQAEAQTELTQRFSSQDELGKKGGNAEPAVVKAEKRRECFFRGVSLFYRRLELKIDQGRDDDRDQNHHRDRLEIPRTAEKLTDTTGASIACLSRRLDLLPQEFPSKASTRPQNQQRGSHDQTNDKLQQMIGLKGTLNCALRSESGGGAHSPAGGKHPEQSLAIATMPTLLP